MGTLMCEHIGLWAHQPVGTSVCGPISLWAHLFIPNESGVTLSATFVSVAL